MNGFCARLRAITHNERLKMKIAVLLSGGWIALIALIV